MNKIIGIVLPFLTLFVLLRFKNIWKLKEYLKQQDTPNKMLIRVYEYYFHKYSAWIGYKSTIGKDIVFPHGFYGVFISNDAIIGDRCVIFQQVTIGSNTLDAFIKELKRHSPIIGNDCYIGVGAKVIGGIKISDNCRIGANVVVYKDIPYNSLVVVSSTIVYPRKEKMDNTFYSYQNGGWKFLVEGKYVNVDQA